MAVDGINKWAPTRKGASSRFSLSVGNEQAAAGRQKNNFPCFADYEQAWQRYPVDPYFATNDGRTYIHTYKQYNAKAWCTCS